MRKHERATSPDRARRRARYHFEMKPAVPGRADEAKAGDREGGHGQRHLAADAGEVLELHRADAIEDRADRQEERRLHQRMIDDVDEPAGQAGLVGEPDAERDVADLRDRRIGEHALQIGLEHRNERGDEHRRDRQRDDDLADRAARRSRSRRRRPRSRSGPADRSRPWSRWRRGRPSPRMARRRRRWAARHAAETARASG